jgi:lysylphosphatidylglycerol synthetase-like protein (DUF2156 family)
MKSVTRRVHLFAGALGVLVFLFTGYVLRTRGVELAEDDRLRFSLRANHVYILLSALLNLVLGAYLAPRAPGWRARLQAAGSVLVLAGAVALPIAFFIEPKAGTDRPLTLAAVAATLGGTLLHVGGGRER